MRLAALGVVCAVGACGPTTPADPGADGGLTPGVDAGPPPLHDGAPPPPPADAAPDAPPPCATRLACDVAFDYPGGPGSVDLRGDFRPGGWASGAAMTRAGDHFTTRVTLQHGQRVQYKFVVDGATWVRDPANPATSADGQNSVLAVDCGACPAAAFDWRDAVLYFVLVDRFADGDPAGAAPVSGVEAAANWSGGDLAGVREKIQSGYFTDLGVNALWLSSPVDGADGRGLGDDGHWYAAYHGYWPTDLTGVESRVGDLAELRAVVLAAHAAGIRVILDYVMNHVHEDSPIYAAHRDWFWPQDGCVCGEGCSWDAEPDRLRCWFRSYLPDFDFRNADARAFSVENAVEWVKGTGVDGFRLDAVKHIETQWVRDLRRRLREEVEWNGQVFLLEGETYTGDRGLIRSYVDPSSMLDGQFDFPLRAQLVRTLLMRRGTMYDLDGFLGANDGFYGGGAVMGTFLGNHDVPRAIHFAEDAPLWGDEWSSGRDRSWGGPGLPADPDPFERLAVAYTLLMTVPGIPLLYYGDEIGMPGAGDPDNRRMMQWSALTADQEWLRGRVARLARLRAEHPALRRGARRTLGVSDDGWVYEMSDGADRLLVALNRGDGAIPAPGLPAGAYRDLVLDAPVAAPATLPPRAAMILRPE